MTISNQTKWYLFIFISTILWSLHALAIHHLILQDNISPNLITFTRFFVWWLFLFLIWVSVYKIKVYKELFVKDKLLNKRPFILSVIFLLLNFLTFHIWLWYTHASNWILIESLSPVLIFLIILFISPKKFWNVWDIKKVFFSVLVWTVWVALIITNYNNVLDVSQWDKLYWDFIEVLWMVFFALFLWFSSELRNTTMKYSGIIIISVLMLSCAIFTLPFWALSFWELLNLDINQILLLTFLSIWSTGIAYLCWFLSVTYLNVLTVVLFINLRWIISIMADNFYYNDVTFITWQLVIWAILIFISSSFVEYKTKKMWNVSEIIKK